MLPLDASPALQLEEKTEPQTAGGYKKASLYATSDTDDEMDNTETISEWELERKMSKVSACSDPQNSHEADPVGLHQSPVSWSLANYSCFQVL